MKKSMFQEVSLAILVSLLCLVAGNAASQENRMRVAVNSGTPVLDVTETLVTEHHWNINYEDWGATNPGDLGEVIMTNGSNLLVRKPSSLSVDIPAPDTVAKSERKEVMKQILESQDRGRTVVLFGSSERNGALQVYPVAVRQPDGKLQQVTPLFDTPVTLLPGSYSLGEIVNEVVAQVQQKRGVTIVLGTIPQFLFRQDTVTAEANEEPARDLLLRAFADINGPRLARKGEYVVPVWSLRYDPTSDMFYLNVGFAERVPFSEMVANQVPQQGQTEQGGTTSEATPGGITSPFMEVAPKNWQRSIQKPPFHGFWTAALSGSRRDCRSLLKRPLRHFGFGRTPRPRSLSPGTRPKCEPFGDGQR